MKILCITDSLGLPRLKPELVEHKDTWVNILSKNFEVKSLSIGGGIIKDFTSQLEYLKMYEPDVVIVQIGIVDCAPRALTKLENHLINKYYLTRKLANKLLPRYSHFLRRNRGISYTTLKDYARGLSRIEKTFSCNVYAIPILRASKSYEEFLPGISKKITAYNTTLKSIFENNYIDLVSFDQGFIMSDNIHLNKSGHSYMAKIISRLLNSEKIK